MIFVSVVIFTGLMLIVGHVAVSLNRRSRMIDRRKGELLKRKQQIHQEDQRLMKGLTDSIVDGKALANALSDFVGQRAALLSEKGPDAGAFKAEDVDAVLASDLQRSIKRINSKIILSISVVGIAIAIVTTAAAAGLYTYVEQSARPLTQPDLTDNSTPYDPFNFEPDDTGELSQ